jgi:hypothetical protein
LIGRLSPETTIACEEARMRPKDSEVERLLGCNKKIKSLTNWNPNWNPQYDLSRGLSETLAWFEDPAHRRRYDSEIYNV